MGPGQTKGAGQTLDDEFDETTQFVQEVTLQDKKYALYDGYEDDDDVIHLVGCFGGPDCTCADE